MHIRTVSQLIETGLVSGADRGALDRVAERYAIAISPAMRALIEDPADPIGLQFVPSPDELVTASHETGDPTADQAFSPVKGIVHRHADRVLLKPLLACPVYCRFCFRREHVGPGGGVLTPAELEAAIEWIAGHRHIQEVILTGGDPLLLAPRRIGFLLRRLEAIPHVTTLRIHTRVPTTAPELVTAGLGDALLTDKPLWMVLHANHAREFTPGARAALERLRRAGLPLLGQSVLLRGVNDSEEALEALFRAMLAARVKPYYLHQLDPAPGTTRFYVPVERGLALLAALRPRLTGIAFPTYVQDKPFAGGKQPLANPPACQETR